MDSLDSLDSLSSLPADIGPIAGEEVAEFGGPTSARPGSHSMAKAGRVRELTPGALALADAMFAWAPAPWCPNVF